MDLVIRYYCIMGQTISEMKNYAEKIASNITNVALSAKN